MFILDTTAGGVQKYRMQDPHIYMMENFKYDCEFGNLSLATQTDKEKIFIHFSALQNKEIINFLEHTTKKIIIDVDDYWEVPKNHYLYYSNKQNNVTKTFLDQISKAHAIIVSTTKLKKAILRYNKNVYVIKNSLNYAKEIKHTTNNNDDKKLFTIGWAGGSSHIDDIKLLSKIGLLTNLKDCQFALAGFDNRSRNSKGEITINNNNTWCEYEKAITNNYKLISEQYKNYLIGYNKHTSFHKVDLEPYKRIWSMDVRKYLQTIQTFDCFLIPLIKNNFNQYKSELKIVEAALHRIPIIVSNIDIYSTIIDKCNGGIIVENNKVHRDFTKAIKKLQYDPDLRKEMGDNLYNYCLKHHDYKVTAKQRLKIYNEL